MAAAVCRGWAQSAPSPLLNYQGRVVVGSTNFSGTGAFKFALAAAVSLHDIRDLDAASDALLALRPVAFTYKPEIDPQQLPQFGLIAEEVEKICPALVAHDEAGQPYTARYEAVNATLLNESLKQHKQVQALTARIDALEAALRRTTTPPAPTP